MHYKPTATPAVCEATLAAIPADARVVMLCGVSGSGKTTLARLLERQGWTRLSADAIASGLCGNAYDSLDADGQRRVYMQAGDEITARIPALLADGARVVIDASMCRRAKRDSVRAVCAEAGAPCALIYLTATRAELLRRLERRQGNGADDQIVPAHDLDRFLAGFQIPETDENAITINTNP